MTERERLEKALELARKSRGLLICADDELATAQVWGVQLNCAVVDLDEAIAGLVTALERVK